VTGMDGEIEFIELRVYEIPDWVVGIALLAMFFVAVAGAIVLMWFRGRNRP